MQLRHLRNLLPASELTEGRFQKITALAFAPNNSRLAVVTVDRVVLLFDENGEQKDKFATKPADKNGTRNYIVRAVEFSPDSTKLAVAQSDNIVYVYKLGLQWGDAKSICNKFLVDSPVTSMCWPVNRPNEVIFGTADGELRVGILRNNKSATLYQTNSYVLSIASSLDGESFVSGHMDGSVYRYTFPDADGTLGPSQALLAQTESVPYALSWGEHIAVAGTSRKVQFYSPQGGLVQTFDYGNDPQVREFTCGAFNPTGQTLVMGNFDGFYTYTYNAARNSWSEAAVTHIPNLLTITALRWRLDGSRVAIGSVCGALDIYDACLRRFRLKGAFEVTYTSPSSLILKRLATGAAISIQSKFNFEILKINVYQDAYVVAPTQGTLILANITTGQFSEVAWTSSGKERYCFESPALCMVFNGGELSLVEYGSNDVLGSCRTEYVSPHLISVRVPVPAALLVDGAGLEAVTLAEAKRGGPKKIAYLLDSATIRVLDLRSGASDATISHDSKIDWLELNHRGNKLLFRDKRRAVYLFDLVSQQRCTLLEFCNYIQWVPDADVVLGQSRRNMHIWYSIDAPEQAKVVPIKGEVQEIQRTPGHTDVLINDGMRVISYPLDEALISFTTALEDRSYDRAVSILEELPATGTSHSDSATSGSAAATSGVDAMWRKLAETAQEDGKLHIAQRCYTALGDIATAEYLSKLLRIAEQNPAGVNHFMVRAKLALLQKQYKRAEAIYLEQGQVEHAIQMYRSLHKWDAALVVAKARNHPFTAQLAKDYFDYLLSSDQQDLAGDLKQNEGAYDEAIQLYLVGGFAGRAADLVLAKGLVNDSTLLETIATALTRKGDFEKAGDFLERVDATDRALDAYRRAHAFRKAVELCRRSFPELVIKIEEEWGDWLSSQRQYDAACNHYNECGNYFKAVNAAIEAKQWNKLRGLEHLPPNEARPFYHRVAQHFHETKQLDMAERHYIAGGFHSDAVRMYSDAGLWDKAYRIAKTYMKEAEVKQLYLSQAQQMESAGKWRDAEQLYLTINDPDRAISMYRKNRQHDDMLRLIAAHRRDGLEQENLRLAKQFELEGQFRQAEQHYSKTRDWQACVSMYRAQNMVEDMLRVAKSLGGVPAWHEVAYAYAQGLGGDQMLKFVEKLGLADACIDMALKREDIETAFLLSESLARQRLPDVHLQFAMSLEDQGRFDKAEAEFILAGKPKEAIEMHCHTGDFGSAMRIAEASLPSAIPDVLEAQGQAAAKLKDFAGAEAVFLQARKPELAIRMFQDAGLTNDAVRLARSHAPHLVAEIMLSASAPPSLPSPVNNTAPAFNRAGSTASVMASAGTGAGAKAEQKLQLIMMQAQSLEAKRDFTSAISKYLEVTPNMCADEARLQQAWANAVEIAMDKVPERLQEVVSDVSRRLCDLGRHEAAAQICLSIDAFEEAVQVYVKGGMFEAARALASRSAPSMIASINKQEKDSQLHLHRTGAAAGAAAGFGGRSANDPIEKCANLGDWQRVHELARAEGSDSVLHWSALHAKALVQEGKIRDALTVLAREGASPFPEHYDVYKRIAAEVLHSVTPSTAEDVALLRVVMSKLTTALRDLASDEATVKLFDHLLLVSHFATLKQQCEKSGLPTTAAKLSISLLRYSADLAVDKAFYEAGCSCRDQQWTNMAFLCFNRFIDLTDLVEDENGNIENTDFVHTDIPSPFDVALPDVQHYPEEVREEVRNWVLDHSLSVGADHTLPQRTCEKCNKSTYEASLVCHHCKATSTPCIVTGYPVARSTAIKCKGCERSAVKADWNAYVAKCKTCPWCGTAQNPQY